MDQSATPPSHVDSLSSLAHRASSMDADSVLGQQQQAEEVAGLREAAIQASLQELLALYEHKRRMRGATGEASSARMVSSPQLEQQQQPPSQTGASSSSSPPPPGGQLLVVANRLPITVSKDAKGEYQFKMSSGGLVSALVSVRDKIPFLWIGWLGKEIPTKDQPAIKRRLLKEFRCLPVFVSDDLADRYYAGFSNDVLWPLLHYEADITGAKRFDWGLWEAYKEANAIFAEAVLGLVPRGPGGGKKGGDGASGTSAAASASSSESSPPATANSGSSGNSSSLSSGGSSGAITSSTAGSGAGGETLIWVHDYHLMVLPALLRRKLPHATIAWFLHTPFPSSEVFRTLPVRSSLLRALLTCDLLGFHVFDYARHFLSSCARLLPDVSLSPSSVTFRGHTSTVGVYPIGIEPDSFTSVARSPACQARLKDLSAQFGGMKVVVSVDRLDPIKGLPHRLLGLETLFRRRPEWVGKMVFIQVAVPSRADVVAYQKLTSQVNKLVGRINGTYGTLVYQPVHYMYRSISPTELCALYCLGDVALVTSLRDGMNLVASEYIAVQGEPCPGKEGPGVLVLSEFAGCVQSLSGCVRVNPWNPDDVADGLHAALTMTPAEKSARWAQLNAYITTFTSRNWASTFVAAMQGLAVAKRQAAIASGSATAGASQSLLLLSTTPRLPVGSAVEHYKSAHVRILLLYYEGCLVPEGGMMMTSDQQQSSEDEFEEYSRPSTAATVAEGGKAPPPAATTAPPAAGATPSSSSSSPADVDPLCPPRHLRFILRDLTSDPSNVVVLVSGASREALQRWFGDIHGLRLIAENGALVRLPELVPLSPDSAGGIGSGGWALTPLHDQYLSLGAESSRRPQAQLQPTSAAATGAETSPEQHAVTVHGMPVPSAVPQQARSPGTGAGGGGGRPPKVPIVSAVPRPPAAEAAAATPSDAAAAGGGGTGSQRPSVFQVFGLDREGKIATAATLADANTSATSAAVTLTPVLSSSSSTGERVQAPSPASQEVAAVASSATPAAAAASPSIIKVSRPPTPIPSPVAGIRALDGGAVVIASPRYKALLGLTPVGTTPLTPNSAAGGGGGVKVGGSGTSVSGKGSNNVYKPSPLAAPPPPQQQLQQQHGGADVTSAGASSGGIAFPKPSAPGSAPTAAPSPAHHRPPLLAATGSSWFTVSPSLAGAPLRIPQALRLAGAANEAPVMTTQAADATVAGTEAAPHPHSGRQSSASSYSSVITHHHPDVSAPENVSSDVASSSSAGWKQVVLPLMSHFADRTPGSRIEEGDNSLRFVYDAADPDLGSWTAKQLQLQLESIVITAPLEVTSFTSGSRVVEARAPGASLLSCLLLVVDHASSCGLPVTYDYVLALTSQRDPLVTMAGDQHQQHLQQQHGHGRVASADVSLSAASSYASSGGAASLLTSSSLASAVLSLGAQGAVVDAATGSPVALISQPSATAAGAAVQSTPIPTTTQTEVFLGCVGPAHAPSMPPTTALLYAVDSPREARIMLLQLGRLSRASTA